jgi:hypothetical protein
MSFHDASLRKCIEIGNFMASIYYKFVNPWDVPLQGHQIVVIHTSKSEILIG